MMLKRFAVIILLLVSILPISAQESEIPVLIPEVLNIYSHDSEAFTQGLLWFDGVFYESTGIQERSSLRKVEIETGDPLEVVPVADEFFAEGLEKIDDKLIQLTWQSGVAFVYDFETFEQIDTINYDGEGWGLCYDGRYLFMSDSTSYLSVRDPETFDLIFRGAVTAGGQIVPPQLLNELECVGDHIYANAWNTDYIFKIDKFTGDVVAFIDASSLLTAEEHAELSSNSVLNGIAYNPESETFFITGKFWSQMFEVVFTQP
jgi:glutaminyl-peptide cyclotransferase